MKKRRLQLLMIFSAVILFACGQGNTNETQNNQQEANTEQTTTDNESSKKDQEKEDTKDKETEESVEVDDDLVMDRIIAHIKRTMEVESDQVMIIQSEQEGYKIYEARMQNPEDPNVTNLLGMYRYYPEDDKLEVYNLTNDTYDPVE